jgi:hypothetical protein
MFPLRIGEADLPRRRTRSERQVRTDDGADHLLGFRCDLEARRCAEILKRIPRDQPDDAAWTWPGTEPAPMQQVHPPYADLAGASDEEPRPHDHHRRAFSPRWTHISSPWSNTMFVNVELLV